jgi:response regulator of citrate/malate metabolism
MRGVLELVNSRVQTTAADLAANLGIGDSTARQYLRRLADEHRLITRINTGVYGPVTVSQVAQVSREQDCADSADERPSERDYPDETDSPIDLSLDDLVVSGG